MRIIEVGTGYTPIPAKIGAATEVVAENLWREFSGIKGVSSELADIRFNHLEKGHDKLHLVYLSPKLDLINDKGMIHVLRRIVYSFKLARQLKKDLSGTTEKVIVHFHNQFNFLFFYYLNKRKMKQKKIFTAFTVHSPSWSMDVPIPKNLRIEKFSIQKADIVIALTDKIKEIVLSKIAETPHLSETVNVISNGVNVTTYFRDKAIAKENIIINIGSICPRKNQLYTIQFLKDFLVKNNYQFVFAGKKIDVPYFNEIENYIQQHQLTNHVVYAGEITPGKTLNNWYNKAKYYLSHSTSEAFSLVVFESLAAGTPVLLSEDFKNSLEGVGPTPAIKILPDKMMLEELNNSGSGTDNNDYEKLSAEASSFANAFFSWTKIAEKHYEIFNKAS